MKKRTDTDYKSAECRLEKEAIMRFASRDAYIRKGSKGTAECSLAPLSHYGM